MYFLAIATNIPQRLKGIVHPKMKILSSFTHPQVVPNLYECLCSAEHKEDILKKVCNQAVLGTIDHSRKKNMVPQNCSVSHILQISSFVFSRTKTFIQVWNYLRVSKLWQNFHFWMNYPLRLFCGPRSHMLYCNHIAFFEHTLPFKSLGFAWFFSWFSYAHQGCIYWSKNTVNINIWNIITI